MKGRIGFAALMVLQSICGAFLLWNILTSVLGVSTAPISWALYEVFEIGAVVGLILGMMVSASVLVRSLRKQARTEETLRLASGSFMEVLEERFTAWGLTPAERDVALFSIKGLSTAEIAALRSTSEGTVKAQTNAIYRKAGVSGRPQLLSLFIEDLMSEALPGAAVKVA